MSEALPPLPKRIETERLDLRPFEFGDVDDLLAYAADPEWARFLSGVPQPYKRTDTEQDIARCILSKWTTNLTWAIELDGQIVGAIDLSMKSEHSRAELAYTLARRHWGHGFTTEAAQAVIDAAFETWPDLNRIHANADARNPASLRVMGKVGMQREGTPRQHDISRGEEPHDSVECGLLREEWEQARKPT